MDNSFFAYLQQLELIAFFSGYPLIYTVIHFSVGNQQVKNDFKNRIPSYLPFAYALVGALYLALQLKNLYPDYSVDNLKLTIQQPWLMSWGLLSILFWIPVLSKKKILSLLHSLVFFFILIRDLFIQFSASSAGNHIVKNDMNIYTISLALNLGALIIIVLFCFLCIRYKKSV